MTDQEFFQKCHDLENRIEQLEAVINRIATDSEPKFERAEKDASYYTVQLDDGCRVVMRREEHWSVDNNCYNLPNYFHTKERAQEVLDKIKILLKLERLHDVHCPSYKPDWSSSEKKYLILYNYTTNRYSVGNAVFSEPSSPCFPTAEIAQKVCDILNKENRFV